MIAGKSLDRADRRILEALQRDGRMTFEALSEQVHLSSRACLTRVRRLEAEGYILGYHAHVDAHKVADCVSVFAQVLLKEQSLPTRQNFEKRLLQCEEVVACHFVASGYDYLVRIICSDMAAYHAITAAWVNDHALAVGRVMPMVELQAIKEQRTLPQTLIRLSDANEVLPLSMQHQVAA